MHNPSQSYHVSVELVGRVHLEVKSVQVEATDLDFPAIPGMADSPVFAVLDPAEPLEGDVAVARLVPVAT